MDVHKIEDVWNQKKPVAGEKFTTPWKSYYLFIILSLAALAMIAYMGYSGRRMSEVHAPLVDAAMEIKLEAVIAHLLLMERISGNQSINAQEVMVHVSAAEWYAKTMLEGGANEEGTFISLNDPTLRRKIKDVLTDLIEFERIMQEQLASIPSSGVDGEIDQQYNAIFNEFITQVDEVETALQAKIASRLRSFKYTQYSLMGFVVVLCAGAVLLFHRYERERAETFRAVQSARHRAETSEEWLSTTMDSMGDAVIATDAAGRVTYMNPVAVSLTGWNVKEAKERLLTEVFNIVNEKTNEPAENPVDRVIRENVVVGLANHTALISRDGARRQIADSGAPIRNVEGEIAGVVLVFRDVTGQYRLEAERNRLITILESTSDMVATATLDSQVTYINRAGKELLGWASDEDIATKVIPDVHPKWAQDIVLNEGIPAAIRDGVWAGETALLHRDGMEIPVSQVIMACKSPGGDIEYFSTIIRDITGRKQAEESLRESEAKFRNIIESSPMGMHMYQLEPDDRLVFIGANPAANEILGVDNRMFVGKTIEEAFPPLIETEVPESYRRVALGGQPWQTDQIIYEDNRIAGVFEVYAFQTSPGKMAATFLDVTKRKRAEEALRENEAALKSIFRAAPTGIGMVSDRVLTQVNERMCDMLGYSSEELLKKNARILYPSDEEYEWVGREKYAQISKWGTGTVETRFKHKDGSVIDVLLSSTPINPADLSFGVTFTALDITERKRAEEEMKRLRNLLKNIVDSMPSVLVGIDRQGRVIQWNREAERATGVAVGEAQGRTLADVFPQLAGEMEKVRQAIREREVQKDVKVAGEVNGETRFSDVTVYPLISNGVEGAVIRVDDVTERVRIEEMMIQSEKMLTVGGLAAGMAHEINNPLAGILQNIQVIRNRLSGDLPQNHRAAGVCGITMEAIEAYMDQRGIFSMIESVSESGRRAAQIVDNMLSFSRKSESKFTPHDLGELLDKTVDLASSDYDLKKKYDFRQIEIVREYDAVRPKVLCEGGKIQQVILNILKNGAQAMAEDKDKREPPRFTLRAMYEGDMACIEIEDNGPGMDEATRNRVFEPFFTTKGVGAGTGLGLSVSYFIIVENHDGMMAAESSPGHGAKFIILLPLKKKT